MRRPAGHVPAGRQRQQGADRGLVRHGDDRLAGLGDLAPSSRRCAPWPRAAIRRPAAGSRGPRRSAARKALAAPRRAARRWCGLPRCRSSSRAGAESTVTAAEGCSSSAVRRARCSGLHIRCQPSAGGGRRQRRAAASPAALSGVSVRPCRRPLVVPGGGRVAQDGEGHAAHRSGPPARRPAHGRRRARRDGRRSALAAAAASRARSSGASSSRRDGRGEGRGIADRRQQAGDAVGHDRGHAAGAAGDHRQAGRLGFEKGHAVGFVDRGPKVKVGAGIKRRQLLVRQRAGKAHALAPRAAPSGASTSPRAGPSPTSSARHGLSFSRTQRLGQHAIGVELVARAHHADAQQHAADRWPPRAARRRERTRYR